MVGHRHLQLVCLKEVSQVDWVQLLQCWGSEDSQVSVLPQQSLSQSCFLCWELLLSSSYL